MRLSRCLALLLLAGLPSLAWAQACELPHPFDRLSALHGTAAFVAGDGAGCDLQAALEANGSGTSGAFAWYSVPERHGSVRFSFRVNLSEFAADFAVDGVYILAVTSRSAAAVQSGIPILRIALIGGTGPLSAYVEYFGYCGVGSVNSMCGGGEQFIGVDGTEIADGDRLSFEIGVGTGTDGWVRYWLNSDFTDPPTLAIENLDNGAMAGPEDIALGAFGPGDAFAPTGTALRFFDIVTSDDELFWSGLDD
jgi:hypothetical protein